MARHLGLRGGQIGAVKSAPSAAELIARRSEEYEHAKAALATKTALTSGARMALAAE